MITEELGLVKNLDDDDIVWGTLGVIHKWCGLTVT